MENVLSSRAMLSGVRISQWSARKLDRKITDQVNSDHGASADAGRYNKALLAKDALASVTSAASEARTYHYARTLPWLDDGARILPAAAFLDYSAAMRRIKGDFDAAVAKFVDSYPSFVSDARVRLNGMFNVDDYPTESEIRSRFGFETRILPIPDARDFRVTIGDAAEAAIRSEVEKATRDALEHAMGDAWSRVGEAVRRMVERLGAYKPAGGKGDKSEGVFRDSLVQNVRDLVAILPSLNLTGNSDLARVCERMESELCGHDADELRESAPLRSATAKAAESILNDVSAFLA